MAKCRQNANFEEINTESLTGKKMIDFDYFQKYLRNISNEILL